MSKGNTQANNGEVCNHLSAFNPKKTASPIAANNWVPRLAYRIKNFLLLSGCCLWFIVTHLNYIGTHMALPVKSGGWFYLQFTGI